MSRRQAPKPNWDGWPKDPAFIGPDPYIVGVYIIITYIGYRRKDVLFKGHHYYMARCRRCGREVERMQDSLRQASRKKTLGCVYCAKKRGRATDKDRRKQEKAKRVSDFNAWVELLQNMPVTPLQFRKGFDTERAIKEGILK